MAMYARLAFVRVITCVNRISTLLFFSTWTTRSGGDDFHQIWKRRTAHARITRTAGATISTASRMNCPRVKHIPLLRDGSGGGQFDAPVNHARHDPREPLLVEKIAVPQVR